MITREKPFDDLDNMAVAVGVCREGLRLSIPEYCPEEYATLMRSCWHENAVDRPSFASLFSSLRAFRHKVSFAPIL